MAAGALEAAISLTADPGTSVMEKVVAVQAAHRVRGDLEDRGSLPAVQCDLVESLEALDDLTAACEVAKQLWVNIPPVASPEPSMTSWRPLYSAWLELARPVMMTRSSHPQSPLPWQAAQWWA
jgi:hypothetical protein